MKYHVSKSGVPARCTATVKPCPLGEETPHFNTIQETVKYIEENAKNENKTFNSMKKGGEEFSVEERLKQNVQLLNDMMNERNDKEKLKKDEKDADFLARVNKLASEFEKNNKKHLTNVPDNEIVDGKFSGSREMVDAVEKQIIQAKAAGENIEYMRTRKGFNHTITLSGDYKPLKKLADTVDYYNENYAPVHHVYNVDKKDYAKVKELMGEISQDYDMPRKPLRGGAFKMPITLNLKDHKALTRKLIELGVDFS